MRQERKNKHICSPFFRKALLLLLGMLVLICSSIMAQQNQGSRLIWVEGERNHPMVVASHKALFQIKFIDEEEREPDRYRSEVWIDANTNGLYDDNEKITLTEVDPNESLSQGKVYSTLIHFLDGNIGLGDTSDYSQLPESFRTKFCFYFEIDGNQIGGDGVSDFDPADPNNLLIVLNKTKDKDGDGVFDLEEGAELLPKTYWRDPNQDPTFAYDDNRLASLMTPGGRITMKIDRGRFLNVDTVPDPENDPNFPEETISELNFPYGFISFRIEKLGQEAELEEVELKILFPTKISNYAEFCRYHSGAWRARIEYSSISGEEDVWRYEVGIPEIDRQSLILILKDHTPTENNPKYDSNEEKGVIDDPWGLGVPKDSGIGRCFIHTLKGPR